MYRALAGHSGRAKPQAYNGAKRGRHAAPSQHHTSQLPPPKMQAPQCWCRWKAAAYAAAASCCGCTTSDSAAGRAKGGVRAEMR